MSKLRSFYHIIAIMFCEPLKSHLKTTKKLYKHFSNYFNFFSLHYKDGTTDMAKSSRKELEQNSRGREHPFKLRNKKQAWKR